jgi:gluconolactonase
MSLRESEFEVVAEGMQYPEGPVWMADGSLVAVDVQAGTMVRYCASEKDAALRASATGGSRADQGVRPTGWTQSQVLNLGGSPNGAALGPDGAMYICNSGGFYFETLKPPKLPWTLSIPVAAAQGYTGGSIQRVSMADGSFETWCASDSVAAPGLRGPDDLVFDSAGGIWFTDWGKPSATERDITGVYYLPAGSRTPVLKMPLRESPNGIVLSPKGDRVYVAETNPRWIVYWELDGPGSIKPNPKTLDGAYLLSGGFRAAGNRIRWRRTKRATCTPRR